MACLFLCEERTYTKPPTSGMLLAPLARVPTKKSPLVSCMLCTAMHPGRVCAPFLTGDCPVGRFFAQPFQVWVYSPRVIGVRQELLARLGDDAGGASASSMMSPGPSSGAVGSGAGATISAAAAAAHGEAVAELDVSFLSWCIQRGCFRRRAPLRGFSELCVSGIWGRWCRHGCVGLLNMTFMRGASVVCGAPHAVRVHLSAWCP